MPSPSSATRPRCCRVCRVANAELFDSPQAVATSVTLRPLPGAPAASTSRTSAARATLRTQYRDSSPPLFVIAEHHTAVPHKSSSNPLTCLFRPLTLAVLFDKTE